MLRFEHRVLTSALRFKLFVWLRHLCKNASELQARAVSCDDLEERVGRKDAGVVTALDVHLGRHGDALVWLQGRKTADLHNTVWLPISTEYSVPTVGEGPDGFWPYAAGGAGGLLVVSDLKTAVLDPQKNKDKQVRRPTDRCARRFPRC